MPTSFTVSLPGGHRAFISLLAIPAVFALAASAVLTLLAGPESRSVAGRAATYFSADGEANLWSWYTGSIFILIGITFAFLALGSSAVAARRACWSLTAVAFYLSADEIASLHELLFQPAAALGLGAAGWLAFGVPLAFLAASALLFIARAIDRVLRRRLVLAGAMFLAGAVGFEAVNEFALEPLRLTAWSPLYILETTIEEGLEFAGTLFALSAALRALLLSSARHGMETLDSDSSRAVVPI